MRDLPSISIVIPVLNGATTIKNTLEALNHQAGSVRALETIVVDGGSTDGTTETVRKFGVKLLEERKRGPAAARNLGLKNATGEIIVYVDSDTLPTRRWLTELVTPFKSNEVILAGGRNLPFPSQTAPERFAESAGFHSPEKNVHNPIIPFVPSMNMAVRRDAARAIGGWTDELLTGEDVDFSYRLLNNFETNIRYIPTAEIFHRNRRTGSELRLQAWMYGQGSAHLYEIHPEVLQWTPLSSIKIRWITAARTISPSLLRFKRIMRVASAVDFDRDLEFAYYHRFWTSWNWRGFFSFRKHKQYTALPDDNLKSLPPQSRLD